MTRHVPAFRIISSVERHNSASPLVALTYDDGPSEWTEPLLDVLRAGQAAATFFVIGEAVDGREETLLRCAADGHEVANHLFTHPRPDLIRDDQLEEEVARTSDRIANVLGKAPTLLRTPYGLAEERVAPIAARHGMPTTVHWSVVSDDWRFATSAPIVKRVMREIHDGAVVSLHDGKPNSVTIRYPSRKPTVRATAEILAVLASDGYRFVTVSELIASEEIRASESGDDGTAEL